MKVFQLFLLVFLLVTSFCVAEERKVGTRIELAFHDYHFFHYDPELYPEDHELLNSDSVSPCFKVEINGTIGALGQLPRVDSKVTTWVPTKFGHPSIRVFGRNKTLGGVMELTLKTPLFEKGHKLEIGDTVAFKLDAVEVLLCSGGYVWHGDFPGKPISPAFTTKGKIANSVTLWAEYHTLALPPQRTAPVVVDLAKVRPKLREFLKSNSPIAAEKTEDTELAE